MRYENYGILHKRELIGGAVCWVSWQIAIPLLLMLAAKALGFWPLDTADSAVINCGALAYTALLTVAVFWRYLREQFSRLRGRMVFILGQLGLGVALWFGLSMAASLLVQVLSLLLGQPFQNANNDAVSAYLAAAPLPMLLSAVVLTPVVEECLFRGLLFCPLANRSRVLGYAVSMGVFAAMHLIAGIGLPIGMLALSFLQYLPPAFALAWVYDRTGTIWPSIFLHFLINSLACFMTLIV